MRNLFDKTLFKLIKTVIVDLTPLKADFTEYFTLYSLIVQTISNTMLINYYPRIVELSGHILLNNQYEHKKGNQLVFFFFLNKFILNLNLFSLGTKELIVQFLRYLNQNYKQELDVLVSQLKEDISREIVLAISN
jgi:hypothetical protein